LSDRKGYAIHLHTEVLCGVDGKHIRSPCRTISMPFADIYRQQARLLVRLLPLISEERCFVLKAVPRSIFLNGTCRAFPWAST
jgi:hypothetical protein